ncbi:MAG TPA: glutathione S-transferase family protein [Reyranella sp.]|nr:glutathione S-transferase family protein [Reyranella sp.]
MADEIVFYTNPQSRGLMTHWMLEECGASYRTELMEYGKNMKSPEYLAINPMGKVPAIKHGDTIVTETGAILSYLADAFPAKNLAPPLGQRGAYYRWMYFVAGPCDAAMSDKAAGWEPSPEMQGRFGYGSFALTLSTLEKAVAGKRYVAADHFTAADLYVASFLNFGMMFNVIEKRPAFEAYVKPHLERPAFRKVHTS